MYGPDREGFEFEPSALAEDELINRRSIIVYISCFLPFRGMSMSLSDFKYKEYSTMI